MNVQATKNILASMMTPQKAKVISKKILTRFLNNRGSLSDVQNKEWLQQEAISDEDWLSPEDAALWALAKQRHQEYVDVDVERIRNNYPKEIHGPGGAYAMLYFLVRKYQPDYMVETGVSLGCSSHAILTAMEENGKGELHSSDFPYFRIKEAEKYIGMVVPERLRGRWTLYLEGDEKNLPEIYSKVPHVDIFHYDSDKSYQGRQNAYDLTAPKMSKGGMMLFDDTNDNAFFYDLLKNENLTNRSRVVQYKGKYIGVVEDF